MTGENWTALFNPCDIDTSELTELGEFVTIHRGKSTGDVSFFCLTQDEVDEYGIAEKHLTNSFADRSSSTGMISVRRIGRNYALLVRRYGY